MKKNKLNILAKIADAALHAAVVSADIPSYAGIYQPKEPAQLQALKKVQKSR